MLLAFVLPIILIAVVLELTFRNIPNDYRYKNQYLHQNAKNIEVLFLGSSHVFFGIDPQLIGPTAFNAAHVSQTVDIDLKVLQKFESSLINIKYIVVPVDYFTLRARLANGNESWRAKNYNLYYNIPVSSSWTDYFEILSTPLNINLTRLMDFFSGKEQITCSPSGWGTTFNSASKMDLEKTGKLSASAHTIKDSQFLEANINCIKAIVAIARKKGAYVVLLSSPAYKTYTTHLAPVQLNEMFAAVNDICRKDSSVVYLNLLNDTSFVREDFYDSDHLNELGAKKLTLITDSILKTKMGRL